VGAGVDHVGAAIIALLDIRINSGAMDHRDRVQ